MVLASVGNMILYFLFAMFSGFLFYNLFLKKNKPQLIATLKRSLPYVWGITFLILIVVNPVSLPETMQEWKWLFYYSSYFIAISLWFGVLLLTAFFSKQMENWQSFIIWYTPMAMLCMSGVLIMSIAMVPMESSSYVGALGMSYGQLLLIKHILLIGMAVYSCMNFLWMHYNIKRSIPFDPKKRWRGEGLLALLIIVISGMLSIQSPPRNVDMTVYFNEPSILFRWIFSIDSSQAIAVNWAHSFSGMLLLAVGFIALLILLLFYRSDQKTIVSHLVILIAGVGIYSGIMSSLELKELVQLSEETREIIAALGSAAFCH